MCLFSFILMVFLSLFFCVWGRLREQGLLGRRMCCVYKSMAKMPCFAGGAVRGCCLLCCGVAQSMPLVDQPLFLKMRCQCVLSGIWRRNDDEYAVLQGQVHSSSHRKWVTGSINMPSWFDELTYMWPLCSGSSSAGELENMRDFIHQCLWCPVEVLSLTVVVSHPWVFMKGGADVQANV